MIRFHPDLLFVESGGDNLAAQFSRELADFTIYVIDVSGGDKIPRKGGPGITQSDLLVINKTDLAPLVGADLDVMARDSRRMRVNGPFLFAQVTHDVGVSEIADAVLAGWRAALSGRRVRGLTPVTPGPRPDAGHAGSAKQDPAYVRRAGLALQTRHLLFRPAAATGSRARSMSIFTHLDSRS